MINQEQKNLFFAAGLIGIVSGICGSLFSGAFFMIVDIANYSWIDKCLLFGIFAIGLLCLIFWMTNQIKNNQ